MKVLQLDLIDFLPCKILILRSEILILGSEILILGSKF
jgi:hypothetical protein